MIYMLWKECMSRAIFKNICSKQNFLYLNGKNVLYPKVAEIINDFLDADKKIMFSWEIIFLSSKMFFNTYTRISTPKFTVRQREGVLT